MTVHALILAGGRGSRLGDVRKGALRIGGQTLFNRIAGRLPDMPILVSTGPDGSKEFGKGLHIADETSNFDGPVAGLRAAARHLRNRADPGDLLLTVAVDTPFLPRDFAVRMRSGLAGGAQAAYAAWGQSIYPTNAIYRLSVLMPLLETALPNSPRQLLESLGAIRIDWTDLCDADPFANLNTLSDLVTLGRRASAGEE